MNRVKRIISAIMCACMCITMSSFTTYANEQDNNIMNVEIATNLDATSIDANVADGSDILLNYIVIENNYIETPSKPYVLVDLGDGTVDISNVKLHYSNNSKGIEYSANAEIYSGTTVAFYLDMPDSSYSGIYSVNGVSYEVDGETYYISVADTGIDARFGVNSVVDVDPYAWLVDENEGNGNGTGITISDADGNVIDQEASLDSFSLEGVTPHNGNYIVVLSAGHGGSDGGACATWNGVTYKERDLNLKIAQYCKAELEKYPGITVYMARNDNSTECTLAGRVQYAVDVHADLYVSIHNNSSGNNDSKGAEVLVPSMNYNPSQAEHSQRLGKEILDKLTSLGLNKRGLVVRLSSNGGTYPDGSSADYYGEVKRCKEVGIPGIIVEHAFISNQSDAERFLGSESALQSLGVADANGIIKYLFESNYVEPGCVAKDDAVEIHAGYVGSKAVTQYQYMIYDFASSQWSILGDYWRKEEIVNWTPKKGSYYVCVKAVLADGSTLEKTIAYNVTKDYEKLSVSDIRVAEEAHKLKLTADVKTSFNSVEYQWMYYDCKTGSWNMIKDWSTSKSVDLNLPAGTYWLHLKAKGNDGVVKEYTKVYTATRDFSENYLDLGPYCILDRGTRLDIGINFASSDSNVEYQWMVYNCQTGSWQMLYDSTTSNWISWMPEKGVYWIHVKAKTSTGVSREYTEVYTVNKSYNPYYITLGGYCVQERDDCLAVGTMYTSSNSKTEFQWMAYDCQKGSWSLISDWSSSNWTIWKPDRGVYWLHVKARNADGLEESYTQVYESKSNYKSGYINLNGDCIIENDNSISVGVSYNASSSKTEFQWMAYNCQTGNWEYVSGWNKSNWTTWKPKKGLYWIHVIARNEHGLEVSHTQVYESKYDYQSEYVDVTGVKVDYNLAANTYTVSPNTKTNSNNLKYQYMIYDLKNGSWKMLKDWSSSSSVSWSPELGDYWINVSVKTPKGDTSTKCVAYNVNNQYRIMGTSETTVDQMVRYYKANATYPAYYSNTDAPTIEAFCRIYMEECEAEGVKAEVAFCQAMMETGFLRYGGQVSIEQLNFAGLGATDGGAKGAAFNSVREGVRAQIQHLKAYATKDALKNACVDPRFNLLSAYRGCAPYVEWLGQSENPIGKGWATAVRYGYNIRDLYIRKLFSY